MKRTSILATTLALSIALAGCSTSSTEKTSHSNWAGVYKGDLPCASCEVIKTQLILNADNSYQRDQLYIKNGKSAATDRIKGKFTWNKDKSLIYLDNKDGQYIYKVGSGYVQAYDTEGEPIENGLNYTLKQTNAF